MNRAIRVVRAPSPGATRGSAPGVHITGLPGTLPPGESVLWQASPDWRSLARHVCHIRTVALYFAILLAGTVLASLLQGATALETIGAALPAAAAAAACLALLAALAWLIARTTEYTLTTSRLVMRFGIALHATLAIPHQAFAHTAVALHADGTGDFPFTMKPGFTIALRRLWPHARPWHLRNPQPMLRCVPGAASLAPLLARTLAAPTLRQATTPQPTPQAAVHVAA